MKIDGLADTVYTGIAYTVYILFFFLINRTLFLINKTLFYFA